MAEPKFRSKDLHYEKTEPAFLQRLRAEHGGERQNVQFARAKKDRLGTGDGEDDGPTIVDEGGESVSKEEYEAMAKGEGTNGEEARSKVEVARQDYIDAQGDEEVKQQQKFAEVGALKKRKQIKVIGDQKDAAKEDDVPDSKEKLEGKSKPKNAASRKKRVKLSFDDETGV